MKRTLSLMLALVMLLGLCACGRGSGKYKIVKTLDTRSYSIAFRNGDSTYHYIDRALKQLNSEDAIDPLAEQWLGDENAVSFGRDKNALADIGYVEPREFIIGVEMDSYPMCFETPTGYSGFDIELAELVCRRLGWNLKIQPIHSEDVFVELNSGNIDCAWGGVVCDTDTDKYTMLRTYLSTDVVIAGRSGGSLRGKTLIIGTSQYYLDLMARNEGISERLGQISRLNGTMSELFRALDNGDCDYILTTDYAVYYANR